MRTVVLLDLKIEKDQALYLLNEYGYFIYEHTGIECEWYVERRDFSVVPTYNDGKGNLLPTEKYRKELLKDVHSRYHDNGTDNVVMWVHEDNFLFKGIWGINYSGRQGYSYSLQLCRWDKDNTANSFGTLYHEQMHSFDWVILNELGVDVTKLFGMDWDKFIVHGGRPDKVGTTEWEYINYQQNTEALERIKPYLKTAFAKRKKAHEAYMDKQKQTISLLSTIITLLQKLLGKK